MSNVEFFPLVEVGDVEMFVILASLFMPSFIGVLLTLIAVFVPEAGSSLSEPNESRQPEPDRAEAFGLDWRRAA